MVFHLDGRNVSVILQGKPPSLFYSVIIPYSISLVHHLLFAVKRWLFLWKLFFFFTFPVLFFFCFLHLHRRRPRPELCGVFLGAAHVGPSLSQPHWLPEFGAEGVGDGWPSLLRQMQPLKEE